MALAGVPLDGERDILLARPADHHPVRASPHECEPVHVI
jgi:hypothetical protein